LVCKWKGIINAYREFLPVSDKTPVVTLYEGNTPLIDAKNLAKAISPDKELNIFLKYEGLNPTGSFKDRGMTLAISKAKEFGKTAVICASTGNTSASAAAYAARAGMKAYVLLPKGAVALGKLSQAMVYGAKIIAVMGNFDDALSVVREIGERYPVEIVNSVNPYRIEGQKTAAFEICDVLENAPDFHFIPVGNAGNITAYWKGYKEYYQKGKVKKLPKMIGWQAEGAAPIVKGYPIKNLLEAYRLVASTEGVFCEPASAASIAGVIKSYRKGLFKGGETIVCTLTGNGLKDPDTVIKASEKPIEMPPDVEDIAEFLGLK